MADIRVTKDVFLQCLSLIYGVAFSSLFIQIPGLFGDNGILPARLVLAKVPESWNEFASQPTFLRFFPLVGFDVQSGMDVLCLGGIAIAFLSAVWSCMRNTITFFLLWSLYLSLFHVGQTFLWFQWDILLLEGGFLSVFFAPFPCKAISGWFKSEDGIVLWLLRWLLFRLMFASGVVKLTSGCPTWWGLTAMNYHYETQCIPPAVAWYFHQLPEWLHHLSIVFTLLIEIPVPLLFFSPFQSHRVFAAFAQIFLMLMIIVTGNYNFFNWLTIAFCLSVMDDKQLKFWSGNSSPKEVEQWWMTSARWAAHFSVGFILAYIVFFLFSVRFNLNTFEIDSKIAFTFDDFAQFLRIMVPITISLGVLSLLYQIATGIVRSLTGIAGPLQRAINVAWCLVFGLGAIVIFSISLVSYARIEPFTQNQLPVQFRQWNQAMASSFRIVSSYGLFRRMTGVDGRPEVIIEGSHFLDGGWKEYEFLYKPGRVSQKPPIVAPHQPRLDWQMWFAALSSYKRQPWLQNFVYRLLLDQQDVLQLIRVNPFEGEPPTYIRAMLYHYHFTSLNSTSELHSDRDWWTRKAIRLYMAPMSKSHPEMMRVAEHLQLSGSETQCSEFCDNVRRVVLVLRSSVTDGFNVCIAFVVTSLAVMSASSILKRLQSFAGVAV